MKSMTKEINDILEVKDTFDAPDKLLNILQKRSEREKLFRRMLELFDYKLDFDWFSRYFQETFANQKVGQVFTPPHTAELIAMLLALEKEGGLTKDPCSGTGVLTIAEWDRIRKRANYKPSHSFFICEELDKRAIPFLLFNLTIRGVNGVVIHCDTITRECWGAFLLKNTEDDPGGFSTINRMSYTHETETHLKVKFAHQYPEQIEIEMLTE